MEDAKSPFLPDGRQWAWNSSSLDPAKQCLRKYWYKVKRGLALRAHGPHITFGAHYAKALEHYHALRTEGKDYETALRITVSYVLNNTWELTYDQDGEVTAGRPWTSNHPQKNRENLIRSIIWYLDTYRDDPCSTVILPDGRPAVELTFQFRLTDEITLCGHLDRLVEYAGDFYVQDQKTTGSSLSSFYFNRYNPDNQMSLYTIAGDVVWKVPVKGVMIDAAQIAVGFTRFERGFTFRTREQNEEWLRDAQYYIERVWECDAKGDDISAWPMNDTACDKYGGCEFRDVCSKAPQVREAYLGTGFVTAFRNPLEGHNNA